MNTLIDRISLQDSLCLSFFQGCVIYCIYIICFEKCNRNISPSSASSTPSFENNYSTLESDSETCLELKQIKLVFSVIVSSGYLCSCILNFVEIALSASKYKLHHNKKEGNEISTKKNTDFDVMISRDRWKNEWFTLVSFLFSFKYFWHLSITTLLMYIVFVAIGAPLFSSIEQTIYCACTLSTLCNQPYLYLWPRFLKSDISIHSCHANLESHSSDERNPVYLQKYINITSYSMITVFGGWLGAIFLPLDWGTKWQIYPFPIVLGSLLGFTLGTFCTLCQALFWTIFKYHKH